MFAAIGLAGALLASAFSTAKPIWPKDREQEKNRSYIFSGEFEWKSGDPAPVMRSTGCSVYRVKVNGRFAYYGPARGPRGYFRVDEVPLAPFLKEGVNSVYVTVAGYNVNSYYLTDHAPFLQAEVVAGGRTLWATGERTRALSLDERVQKVSRYSFQRPFGEAYDYSLCGAKPMRTAVPVAVRPEEKLLPRRAPMPAFRVTEPMRPYARGLGGIDATKGFKPNRAVENVTSNGLLRGFAKQELDANLFYDFQRLVSAKIDPYGEVRESYVLKPGEQIHFALNYLDTGFIMLDAAVAGKAKLAASFDEILVDGRIDPPRSDCGNLVTWAFPAQKAGRAASPVRMKLETFEPYSFKYLTLTALEGTVTVSAPRLREYVYPTDMDDRPCNGCVFGPIANAARRTFAQNAVDCFTDCPGRERAGWLCDSFWTARTSRFITGSNDMEHLFLENFALAEGFPGIEDGMFPMCYPADHDDGWFIPNWSMWLVLELEEFAFARGGDPALVKTLEPRVMKLLAWFAKHENADGLLEKLPSWNFIEWSKANEFTQDVNYPSNMTYAKALDAVARLYARAELKAKAAKVRETVVRQSFDGTFFRDHAVRGKDGKLVVKDDVTETCQYYAFFTDTATPKSQPALWKTLTTEFGPDRAARGLYKEVWPSNAFIGNYLRLDLLDRYGLKEQLKREIGGYFNGMAAATGTLWEHDRPSASCCHGFASYAGVLAEKLRR